MKQFPTGVTVVGAAYNGQKHGMTVNSFTSVSLDPPMVLICITRNSGCHKLIKDSGMFSISVLSEHQSELSRRFADHREFDVHRFLGVDHHLGDGAVPIVDEAVAVLECVVKDCLLAGDHTVFVGVVKSAQVMSDQRPLVFYQSDYVRIGSLLSD